MSVEAAAPAGKHPHAATIMLQRLFIILLSASLAATHVTAQGTNFSALRDSLGRLDDATAVRRIVAARRPARSASADQHIAHGLAALRLYELTSHPADSRQARQSFEAAVGLSPDQAWAQYGLGLTLASSPEAKPLSAGGSRGRFVLDDVARRLTGRDERSRARAAFHAALKAVPPMDRAASDLATLALAAQNEDWLEEARTSLEKLEQTRQAQPADRVALSSVLAALNDVDAAIATSARALAEDGRNGSTLFVAAVARLRSPGREAEGMELYREGIRVANAEQRDTYFADLVPIANPKETKQWSTGDTEARRAVLLRFWDVRAALGGVKVAERAAEHYRRLPFVEQHYRRLAQYGAPEPNELRWLPMQKLSRFDDRGEIYLRHGPPAEKIGTVTTSETDSESWVYRLPGGDERMFHFIYARGGYTLPYNIPCGEDFLRARAGRQGRLGLLSVRKCDPASVALYSADMREAYYEALESDTHFAKFTRELPFFYDLYTFRGPPGKTAVVAAFAVPATKLEKTIDDSGVKYRFDVSLILADTATGIVSRTDDSASVRMPRALTEEDLLRTHLEVEVAPSPSTLQRVIVTDPTAPGIGQLYWGPFPIPDYSGKDLMLSDIALGQVDRSTGWKRGDVTLTLVPTSQFPSASFSLYYEVYNLPNGRAYTTEVVIERVDKGAGDKLLGFFGAGDDVRLRFSGESSAHPDGTLPELRTVGAPLRKGQYRMTVIVRDHETGQSARRSRLFRIPE